MTISTMMVSPTTAAILTRRCSFAEISTFSRLVGSSVTLAQCFRCGCGCSMLWWKQKAVFYQ